MFLPAGSGTGTFSKYTIASNGAGYNSFYMKNISDFLFPKYHICNQKSSFSRVCLLADADLY